MKLKDLLQKVTPTEPPDTLRGDIIWTMPLSKFKQSKLLVRIRCRHLDGEEVFIASTEREAAVGRAEGLVVYTADELIQLSKGKPAPDDLRLLHEAKKILQGTLLETIKRGKCNA